MLETATETIEWVNSISITAEDKQVLNEVDDLSKEFLEYAIDLDENARAEHDNENNARLLSFDVPYFDSQASIYTTRPVVFVVKDNKLYTFIDDERDYSQINHLLNRSFQIGDYESLYHMIFSVLYNFALLFHEKLRILHKERDNIEKVFRSKPDNNEIYRLMNVEKGLVYLLTSLKSNKIALNTLRRRWGHSEFSLKDREAEKLEDVIVELSQAIEVADINMTLVEKEKVTYSTIIDNNLNSTMRMLTVLSSFLAVGEVTFGFFGMNTDVPFMGIAYGWLIVLFLTAVICAIMGYVFWKMRLFK